MEIKKYVLTNKGTIHDISKGHVMGNSSLYGGWEEDRGAYIGHAIEVGEDYPIENETRNGFIVKTSDNILDLVDDNDLVEDNLGNLIKVGMIDYQDLTCVFSDKKEVMFDYEINTIYKKQPNGDYKRYEVKD